MLKMQPAKKKTDDKSKKSDMPDFSQMMSKQMLYFMPLFITFIAWRLPSALAVYWIASTLFTLGQQLVLIRKHPLPEVKEVNKKYAQ